MIVVPRPSATIAASVPAQGGHRVAIVTESFLPHVDGVANSVRRVLDHLAVRGHEALVLAPGAGPTDYGPAEVVRTPSVPLPWLPAFSLGLPGRQVRAALERFRPDVVHLASPVLLGAWGGMLGRRLGVPVVAVYQTDLAGFARSYGWGAASPAFTRLLRRTHGRADLTLAPSAPVVRELTDQGIPRVRHWPRGVDGVAFSPAHRTRRRPPPGAPLRVGYVGRLAPEKHVERLAVLRDLAGVELVVVGDGPCRRRLQQRLPEARFTGQLTGLPLAVAFADLDVFVHTGTSETFCQAAQEALASGVPVVAPSSGGLVDFVTHGRNGLIWSARDPRAIRPLVARLAADPALRRRLAAAARPSVAARSWETVGDLLLEHYATVRRRPVAALREVA